MNPVVVVQQVELRDLMRIKAAAETNPKPLNGRLYNFHALLPLFIIILLVSYFLPGLLRCYFCPAVSISCANLVGLLAGKKALFLLISNFIFILLVVDFTTLISTPSNSFPISTSTLHNDSSAPLQGRRLPSDSNAILVGDAPAAAEQLHDDSLWRSSSLQVEEVISSEQKSSISVDDSFAGENKLAREESKTNIEWRPDQCCNKSQQGGRQMKTAERGNIPTILMEVVVVDHDAIGNERAELEPLGIEDELEHLELEELNRKFDEFIARKKNKWRSEALQLVMHGRRLV